MTSELPLANLVVAGVTKAGTTSLFEYLAQHPDVFPASLKQTNYFRPAREPGVRPEPLEQYAAYFAGGESHRYRVEASPSYFYSGKHLVRAVDETLDDARVVVSLREPVSRFWSHYRMRGRSHREIVHHTDVARYVAESVAAVRRGEVSPVEYPGLGPVSVGLYGEFLGDWLDVFGPRLKVVFFDDLMSDPRSVVAALYRWLDVDDAVAESVSYAVRNRGVVRRSRRLGRMAQRVGRAGAPVLQRQPKVKGWLRAAHDAVNGRADRGGTLDVVSRRLLQDLYEPSNAAVADALRRNGYTALPPWLAADPVHDR